MFKPRGVVGGGVEAAEKRRFLSGKGEPMITDPISRSTLFKMFSVRVLAGIVVLLVILFLPAGTFNYWHAWGYLAIVIIPMLFALSYMLKKEPDLLVRRMRMREPETEQRLIIKLSVLLLLPVFLIPSFDIRFGWSHVPTGMVVAAEILVLLGYGMFFLVMRENRYASRIIEVEKEQQVISSGPYAIIRHPMYVGALIMYIFSPLALGSYWAMIPALMMIPIIVARILNEEDVLKRELKGYKEYLIKVQYRLIPGLW